jgi:hypothetical protein
METWKVILIALALVLNAIAIMVHAFLKGYGGEKGKNLATHEDIDKIVRETEEIKAKIADQSSARNRLFEMRRKVAFRLMNLIGTLDDVLIGAINEADMLKPLPQIEAKDLEKLNELHERYRGIVRRLGQLKGQVALVFDDPARELLSSLDSAAGAIIHVTNHFQYDRDKAAKLLEIYSERYVKLHTLMRKQLLA